ncbi:hypothetical protein OH77DRAFT_1210120 [Trametes cingulata]|nr:hypothetical protein OH77DRAFT_1210120 [Trametes cingulata]
MDPRQELRQSTYCAGSQGSPQSSRSRLIELDVERLQGRGLRAVKNIPAWRTRTLGVVRAVQLIHEARLRCSVERMRSKTCGRQNAPDSSAGVCACRGHIARSIYGNAGCERGRWIVLSEKGRRPIPSRSSGRTFRYGRGATKAETNRSSARMQEVRVLEVR